MAKSKSKGWYFVPWDSTRHVDPRDLGMWEAEHCPHKYLNIDAAAMVAEGGRKQPGRHICMQCGSRASLANGELEIYYDYKTQQRISANVRRALKDQAKHNKNEDKQ